MQALILILVVGVIAVLMLVSLARLLHANLVSIIVCCGAVIDGTLAARNATLNVRTGER